MKEMEYKHAATEIKDVSDGTVLFYASIFSTMDYGNDIIEQGAFAKTIVENFKKIRHYKHHDRWKMPGVIQELKEDQVGLLVKSKMIMDTQLGKETYAEYKAMAAAGKSMDHSVGFNAIQKEVVETDETFYRKLKEIKLYEVSTLTEWGMHPDALAVSVKRMADYSMDDLLKEEKYFTLLLNCEFKDSKLEQIEKLLQHVKAIRDKAAASTLETNRATIANHIDNMNIKFN